MAQPKTVAISVLTLPDGKIAIKPRLDGLQPADDVVQRM